jgi:hypothetical protein
MPITKHAFLGIYPLCHCGDDEAGSVSGRGIIGIVRRFGLEIDLTKINGFRWKTDGGQIHFEKAD